MMASTGGKFVGLQAAPAFVKQATMMSNRDSTNAGNFIFNQSLNMTMQSNDKLGKLEGNDLPGFTAPYCESKLDVKEPAAD